MSEIYRMGHKQHNINLSKVCESQNHTSHIYYYVQFESIYWNLNFVSSTWNHHMKYILSNSYFFSKFWNEKSKKLSSYHKCPKYAYLFEHRLMIACIWINNGVEIWSDMCIVLNLMEIIKVNLAQYMSMFNVQYRIKSVSFTPLFWQVG